MAGDFPALLFLSKKGEEDINAGETQGFIPVGLSKFTFYFIWEMRSLSVFVWEIIFHLNVNTCSILLRGRRM